MPKPTINNLNRYLHETLQQYDLVKGEGYFYFCWGDDAPYDTPEPPESILVPALNQMNIAEWKQCIDWAVENWLEVNEK